MDKNYSKELLIRYFQDLLINDKLSIPLFANSIVDVFTDNFPPNYSATVGYGVKFNEGTICYYGNIHDERIKKYIIRDRKNKWNTI